ncbi:MAG: FAD binding domain-containing protein [Sulfurifustaceae bacterium]
MYAFEFHRPKSVSDAAALLAKSQGKLIAGGQSLVGALKLRLASSEHLIDVGAIPDLRGIKRDGNNIAIGATTRHAEVAQSADVRKAIPALADLANGIGDRQVRNMGTIGGSIANNDPAADYPAAVLGLNAAIRTNKRTIAADDFFKGMYETALAPDEIITAVSFPTPKRAAYIKFRNPASRFALVGVFVADTGTGVRVAVTGAGSAGVFRATAMEQALAKNFSPDAVKGIKIDASRLNSDLHASAEYRAHLITVLTARAVAQASAK